MDAHTSSAPQRPRPRGLRAPGVAVVTLALCLGTATAPAQAAGAEVDRIVTDTNAARVAQGLSGLAHNSGLDAVAQAWAQRMATTGFAQNPDYSTQIPTGWTRASENIAAGYTASTVVTAWLNSPGHRTNIMAAVTDIGVGYYSASGGTTYFVQNFAAYAPGTAGAALRVAAPTPTPTVTPAPTVTPTATPQPQPALLTGAPVPRVFGSALLGRTVTASTGVWAPDPVMVALQWKRAGVTISGATGVSAIAGATGPGYLVGVADAVAPLAVTVTGIRTDYVPVARRSVSIIVTAG